MRNGVGFLRVCNDGWAMSTSHRLDNSDEVICGASIRLLIVRPPIAVAGRALIIAIAILVPISTVVASCAAATGLVGLILTVARLERHHRVLRFAGSIAVLTNSVIW